MVEAPCTSFILQSFSLLTLILIFFWASPVRAEQLYVYPGEVVVETSPTVSTATLATSRMRRKRGLGRKMAVMNIAGHGSLSASAKPAPVPFDPAGPEMKACVAAMLAGEVETCSPNFHIQAAVIPNDPRYASLYGMERIGAPRAWSLSTGGTSAIVAVIDTGVDYTHPDLAGNMWTNPGEIPGNGIDDDANGYVDDVHGYDFANNDPDPFDDNGHGTHVAGTIGASGNNGIGVAGVNWLIKIMALKFLTATGGGNLADAVEAVNYATMMREKYPSTDPRFVNVRVTNNSWGGGGFSSVLQNAISRAGNAGIMFVAAAGNEAKNNDTSPAYPASYQLSNVISVAATGQRDELASFSNYGASSVHIGAPGVGILSTLPGNRYGNLSGTSMAAPHVAGAIAAHLNAHRELESLTPPLFVQRIRSDLLDSAEPVSALAGVTTTGRRLRVDRLLFGEEDAIPVPPTCTYSSAEVAGEVSDEIKAALLAQAPVIQADELNYYTLPIAFGFPYYGRTLNAVTVSPNGLVYEVQPTTTDYQVTSVPPVGSIAALWNDWYSAIGTSYGVSVLQRPAFVGVVWRVRHYRATSGEAHIFLLLHADGRISTAVDFTDAQNESLGQSGLIGVSGTLNDQSYIAAHASTVIRSGLSIAFTRTCPTAEPQPQPAPAPAPKPGATVHAAAVNGVQGNRLTPVVKGGGKFVAAFSGTGTGAVTITYTLRGRDSRTCQIDTEMVGGTLSVSGRLDAALAKRYNRLSVSAQEVSATAAVKRGRVRGRVNARAVGKSFNRLCSTMQRRSARATR